MRALLLVLLLAACAPSRVVTIPRAEVPPPVGPEIVVALGVTGQPARDLLEQVGSRCWLDGVLGGAEMVVQRSTGRVQINAPDRILLAGDFLEPRDGRARLRLSGPAVVDPAQRDRLVASLDQAVRTGQTAC